MMRVVKKLPVIVLIFVMILASAVPAAVQTAEKTTQEKAVVLSNLKIISGVNGEYYLENQLRRNEAVTFIVRLIGKGDYVNQCLYRMIISPLRLSREYFTPHIYLIVLKDGIHNE